MSEPVSNPYRLHTCENCHHAIWDREGCYCNRVIAEMRKVCESGTCEHWALNQYIETNSEEMNKWINAVPTVSTVSKIIQRNH